MKYIMWLAIPMATFFITVGVTYAMVHRNKEDVTTLAALVLKISEQVNKNSWYIKEKLNKGE